MISLLLALAPVCPVQAGHAGVTVTEDAEGWIVAADSTGTLVFADWNAYFHSAFFQRHGLRCRTDPRADDGSFLGTADCTNGSTTTASQYDPTGSVFRIPVVVHVIRSTSGQGNLSNAQVQSQIDILNEDFRALPGSNGAPGTDTSVEFYLATTDPNGQATSGITRHTNNTWYNDGGSYKSSINWDPDRYLNIYTNTAGGYLGYAYVPNGGGVVGQYFDGVVCNWTAFGRNSAGGPPYNQGRTATHEVGHYLGLFHTFDGGCGGGSCYSSGDLICDTTAETTPRFGCPNASSCGSPDPVHNYMDYTDDLCMFEFTFEQANRMRCTIENWRVDLAETGGGAPGVLFADGFESGTWSAGGWVRSNNKPRVVSGARRTGLYGFRIRNNSSAERAISTAGYDSIVLSYSRRSRNLDAGEFYFIEWWNGSSWNVLEQLGNVGWSDKTFNLPAAASNNPNFKIRFRSTGNVNKERGDVDNVEVSGTSL